jgi:hypothetical protein
MPKQSEPDVPSALRDDPHLTTFAEMLRELRMRERAVLEQEIKINEYLAERLRNSFALIHRHD